MYNYNPDQPLLEMSDDQLRYIYENADRGSMLRSRVASVQSARQSMRQREHNNYLLKEPSSNSL